MLNRKSLWCIKIYRWRCLLHSDGYLHYTHERAIDIRHIDINFLIEKNYNVNDDLGEIIYENIANDNYNGNVAETNGDNRNLLVGYVNSKWTQIEPLLRRRSTFSNNVQN